MNFSLFGIGLNRSAANRFLKEGELSPHPRRFFDPMELISLSESSGDQHPLSIRRPVLDDCGADIPVSVHPVDNLFGDFGDALNDKGAFLAPLDFGGERGG